MNADDEALETVARRAGGSMRDAQSLLDQLLAFSGKTLTVESVHQLLGTAHEERVAAIAGAVLAKDPKQVLEIVNQIANQGQQLGELLDQLIDYWRDLMVVNSAGIAGQAVSVSSARRSLLEQHAKRASLDTILAGMDVLVTAKTRMRHSSHVRAILEMALVRLSQLEDLLPIAQIAQWIATEGPTPTSAPPRMTPNQAAPPSAGAEKKKLIRDGDSSARPAGVSLNDENLPSIWQQVIQESGFALQADLRRISNVAISGPNTLVFRINRRYNSSSGAFHDAAKLAKVQELLERIVGQPCAISIEWTDDAAEPKGSPKTPAAAAMGQQRQARVELMKIPFVKNVVDVLNAQIVRADEGFGATAKADLADADEVPQSSDEQDETAT
ncbi:MAG: hypothetical protein HYR84_01860 [Planctomycetes bacterium]|nr:hypothetical protein [Planctomycetota bacterium]